MSHLKQYWNFCPVTRKHRYYDERHAKEKALRLHRQDGAAMSWYACEHCDGFHVGHTPRHLREQGVGTRLIR